MQGVAEKRALRGKQGFPLMADLQLKGRQSLEEALPHQKPTPLDFYSPAQGGVEKAALGCSALLLLFSLEF
jgi:hypothetical protein